MIRLFIEYIKSWIETLRIAPPFSKRRRDILDTIKDSQNLDAWVEAHRPESNNKNPGGSAWGP